MIRVRKQVTSIDKDRALQFTINWKGIFNVEDGVKFSTERVTAVIMRPEITFVEAAHGGAPAIKKTFVDWNGVDVAGAFVERSNQSGAGTEFQKRFAKRNKITGTRGGTKQFYLTANGTGGDLESLTE